MVFVLSVYVSFFCFFFSSRRRHTRWNCDWSSDVCSSDLLYLASEVKALFAAGVPARWDAESVASSVEFGGHQVRTLFDGVFQVPPGHYLLAKIGRASCRERVEIAVVAVGLKEKKEGATHD